MDIGQVEQLLGILKVSGIHVVFVGVYVIRVSDSPTLTFQGHSHQDLFLRRILRKFFEAQKRMRVVLGAIIGYINGESDTLIQVFLNVTLPEPQDGPSF